MPCMHYGSVMYLEIKVFIPELLAVDRLAASAVTTLQHTRADTSPVQV